ncbi:hypothetical protein DID88_006041 [Monilinia fructigena]|uniref:Selenoprotein O n=1 Tax=Monilinia fructigena TaxID=38457 RepID=A0A395J1K8_9HELO|nr:hypothetical protein DID88_006041 [Monilinia fructigena]
MLSRGLPKPLMQLHKRIAQMSSHLSRGHASSCSSYLGTSLADLPKSWTFTSSLPPDPAFPTPAASHKTDRDDIGPRQVTGHYLLGFDPKKRKILSFSRNVRYELQLKGAGITPYSRFADGKAVLRSSIREFIVSEALNGLKIPTTRALSLTLLPHSKVRRETLEPGAIVARFAESWLRIGTFDILRARGERDLLRQLCTYIAENVFQGWESLPARNTADDGRVDKIERGVSKDTIEGPDGLEENRFTRLYREIVRRNAKTVAAWQAYAFTNGVLNTDNTSIFGLSIDFGPFAFLDNFDPNYTPNHDDHMLRYSYRNQPTVIWWNLVRLGESLGELIAPRRRRQHSIHRRRSP